MHFTEVAAVLADLEAIGERELRGEAGGIDVDAAGGTLALGDASVVVPAGALEASTTLTLKRVSQMLPMWSFL